MVSFQDVFQGWRWQKECRHGSLEDCWLEHVRLEQADTMRRCSQVCSVQKYRCPDESLDQIPRLADCSRAHLPRVSILQKVYHGRSLFSLKEIDYADKVIEELESGVHCPGLVSSPADALALPASSKQVHRSMTCDEVAQEEGAAEAD